MHAEGLMKTIQGFRGEPQALGLQLQTLIQVYNKCYELLHAIESLTKPTHGV